MAYARAVVPSTGLIPAPRTRGAVFSFVAYDRARVPEAGAQEHGAAAQRSAPPPRPRPCPRDHAGRSLRDPLVRALVVSLVLHAAAIAALSTLVGVGAAGRGQPFASPPLVATLTMPPQKFVVPETPAVPPPSPLAPSTQAESTAPLPIPLKRKPSSPSVKGSPQGTVTINLTPDDQPVDAALSARVALLYPDAVRSTPEFEVQPRSIYPLGAVAKRMQIDFLVPVVVLEDGRVEVVQGTFDDPLFGPAVRAGLAQARARPAVNAGGRAIPLWSVLSFAFVFAGDQIEPK